MAKKDNKDGDKNLFSKLADLFRSGPVVKRKIKSMDTRVALPNKLDSSSIEIFQKTTSQLYSAITSNAYNNSERLMRYNDFNEMEQTAEIAAALDIWADETCSVDSKGKALHIYSENAQIKKLLDELFYDTINLDFNLRMWARNLCKYGDFVAFIDVHPQFGVLNVIPIPINEIEREEGYDKDDPLAVRYRWVSRGNQILENWQIIHMRLLGNDMFLPYGSSVIEAARRIWRQLILIEDAMLVYRIVRAPDRRVFYIDVGNIEPDQIPNYVEQQRSALRSNQVIDRNTGRVDLRYNPMCLSLQTLIKLQDGRNLDLSTLIKEWESGKQDQWVYSIDTETNNIVPGKIIWAGITRKNAGLVRVWLDDGSYRDTTPDHRFMLRDGTYKKAEDLISGEALMPLYTKLSSKEAGDSIVGYEKIYNPASESYVYTHTSNANSALLEEKAFARSSINWEKNNNLVIHHVNFDRRNNDPSNLKWMGNEDHYKFHASLGRENIIKWNKSAKKKKRVSEYNLTRNSIAMMSSYNGSDLHKSHNSIRTIAMNELWNDSERREVTKQNMRHIMTDDMFNCIVEIVKQNPKWGRAKVHVALMNNNIFVNGLATNQNKNNRQVEKYSHTAWEGELVRRGYDKLSGLRKSVVGYTNHKVTKVEFLEFKEDTGCITVEKWHNFAAGPSSIHPEVDKLVNSFIYLHNSVDEDYFIPVRGGDTGTKIDTLAGGQNTAAVEDVEYIQKKLFAALKIPKAYLGFDEMLSSKATLAQEDIRFSRSVQMVQRTIVSELNKLAIIHLFAHGFTGEDLINFTLKLSNPSSVAQQQKLELFKSKFEIAALAPEGLLSKEFVLKNIIELTDEEINDIQNGLIDDKEFAAKLEAAGATAGGAEGAPGDEMGGEMGAAPEAGAEEAPAGEEPPPENAGRGERDGLIVASNNKSKKPSALLDIDDDDDIDFTEKIDYQNNLPLYKKVKYGVRDRATKRGAHKTHHMPKFDDMLSVKKNKDITGLDSLKADLNPSFLNENSELRILMEKLPDSNTVKPNLTVDIRNTLTSISDKWKSDGKMSPNGILTENDEFAELFLNEEFEIEK